MTNSSCWQLHRAIHKHRDQVAGARHTKWTVCACIYYRCAIGFRPLVPAHQDMPPGDTRWPGARRLPSRWCCPAMAARGGRGLSTPTGLPCRSPANSPAAPIASCAASATRPTPPCQPDGEADAGESGGPHTADAPWPSPRGRRPGTSLLARPEAHRARTASKDRRGHTPAGPPPGKRDALPRPVPLMYRACGSVPAHGSSKPRGRRRLWRWFPALAGLEPTLAGCVHQAGLGTVRRAGSPVVDKIAGGYRLAGDLQPPPLPLLGGLGWLIGGQQPRTCCVYSEDTQIGAGDNGGYTHLQP
jgi:hypothetical protein